MFDANMSYLPKGARFFATVHKMKSTLKSIGAKTGDVVFCHMLNETHDNPCVDIYVNGQWRVISGHRDFTESGFVYAGNADGSGFIDKQVREKAMAVLSDNLSLARRIWRR